MSGIETILIAGLIMGALDLTAATTLFTLRGGNLEKTLRGVASGALGPSAFTGGKNVPFLGLFFHFFIAFSAATVYFLASRQVPMLNEHAVISGMLYGAGIHLFMTFIVLPVSAMPKREFSTSFFVAQLLIHMFIVGLTIALVVRHYS